jgi:hypothetical protein
MFLLSDILTYIRRIIKSPSNSSITDNLLIDYINRFWITDVDARMQLFDLKTKYQFQTQPGVDKYNMPLYTPQMEPIGQIIGSYPVYQGFLGPAYVNGIPIGFHTQQHGFYEWYPNVVQNFEAIAIGNGTAGPYVLQVPILPASSPPNPPFNGILRGHVDISGIIATGTNVDPPISTPTLQLTIPTTSVDAAVFITSLDQFGNNVIVTDSGQFLPQINYGLLMQPGPAPLGNAALPGGYSTTSNTINYLTGAINVTFPSAIPAGNNIGVQCRFFASGLPRMVLYYNNTLTFRAPPDKQFLVELDAYLSPAAMLNSNQAISFGYMAEYIARGAARKILLDTGDREQFEFYEPEFRSQELLVWKRSQRQFTATRTSSLYSQGNPIGVGLFNNSSGGSP